MNVLLDEHLSPTLVPKLGGKGIAAQNVAHLGMSGKSDREVWDYAYQHDQAVATSNAVDFIKLASSVQLHPGLITLRGGLTRDEQWRWREPAIDFVHSSGQDLVNKLVEITGPGLFTIRDLAAP